ncbi:hypothetical protein N0V83_007556 [Neocucurbitaria cava]|uniref:TauD/TfdA-like domain-containing protein n=1 Tax=Neocucurbitaria cava TaxID=798079 RepID=A0A9W9CKB6_9PLEO|nr:hypothetical protein N0V83_007556 [Neocucurbitaria cava]
MAPETLTLSPSSPGPAAEFSGLRNLYTATEPAKQVIRSNKPTETREPVVRPSIKFEPDRADYEARSKRILQNWSPDATLPDGYPGQISGQRVWDGKTVGGVEAFALHLKPEEIEEIEDALKQFKDLPGPNGPDQMARELFPLPTLGPKLEAISKDLHSGRGLTILRGLKPTKYTAKDNVLLFTGLASYIGEQRGCQDRYGNMLSQCEHRYPIKNIKLTDTIQAHLVDMGFKFGKDKPPVVWNARPILFPETNHGPFFCFSRQKITGSEHYPLSTTLPAMSEEQAEALDMVHYVAEEHGIAMTLDPGDVLLYNNLAVLHGRNAFTDVETGDHRRHIMRLWVRNEEQAWETPAKLAREWHLVYGESERRAKAQWKINPEDVEKDRVIGHKMTCS